MEQNSAAQPTPAQLEMAQLLINYTNIIVTSFIRELQSRHCTDNRPIGAAQMKNSLVVLEEYFNTFAASLYDRDVDAINAISDKLFAINVGPKYNPIEFLYKIVLLTTDCLKEIDFTRTYGMDACKLASYVIEITDKYINPMASSLNGGVDTYKHIKISKSDKHFSLSLE